MNLQASEPLGNVLFLSNRVGKMLAMNTIIGYRASNKYVKNMEICKNKKAKISLVGISTCRVNFFVCFE